MSTIGGFFRAVTEAFHFSGHHGHKPESNTSPNPPLPPRPSVPPSVHGKFAGANVGNRLRRTAEEDFLAKGFPYGGTWEAGPGRFGSWSTSAPIANRDIAQFVQEHPHGTPTECLQFLADKKGLECTYSVNGFNERREGFPPGFKEVMEPEIAQTMKKAGSFRMNARPSSISSNSSHTLSPSLTSAYTPPSPHKPESNTSHNPPLPPRPSVPPSVHGKFAGANVGNRLRRTAEEDFLAKGFPYGGTWEAGPGRFGSWRISEPIANRDIAQFVQEHPHGTPTECLQFLVDKKGLECTYSVNGFNERREGFPPGFKEAMEPEIAQTMKKAGSFRMNARPSSLSSNSSHTLSPSLTSVYTPPSPPLMPQNPQFSKLNDFLNKGVPSYGGTWELGPGRFVSWGTSRPIANRDIAQFVQEHPHGTSAECLQFLVDKKGLECTHSFHGDNGFQGPLGGFPPGAKEAIRLEIDKTMRKARSLIAYAYASPRSMRPTMPPQPQQQPIAMPQPRKPLPMNGINNYGNMPLTPPSTPPKAW